LSDPISQLTTFAEFSSQSGLIDQKQKQYIEKMQDATVEMIKNNQWEAASANFFTLAYNISLMAGNVSIYDITNYSYDTAYNINFARYLMQNNMSQILHAGSTAYNYFSVDAAMALWSDVSKSVLPLYKEILSRDIPVIVYNGVYDLLCNAVGVEQMLYSIQYPELIQPFIDTKRSVWTVDKKVAGFTKQYHNLSFIWVVQSGHFVMNEQPLRFLDLVHRFVHHIPF
jgi:carboxypeptidase C (cathepsin A)